MLSHSFPGNKRPFDPERFLSSLRIESEILSFRKRQTIFAQGDPSDAVFYIREGNVRLRVVAENGKEVTIAILGEGGYFGEACLTMQPVRIFSASALSNCLLVRIAKPAMIVLLREKSTFSNMFLSYLLRRNLRYEEDLMDQLFNFSEKRLARILLLQSDFDHDCELGTLKISQETLAQMIGTTRSRVNVFMKHFKELGFIEYNGVVHVHRALAKAILHH
ncbi:MAG: Crp/Fnr family transcriptional regulator [Acidobacteria bacterium]|nr:MAG: Crp/Fnr family transcriptional regulator [Acidobacteriota bacterium]